MATDLPGSGNPHPAVSPLPVDGNDGDLLTWDAASNSWVATAPGAADATDVNLQATTPGTQQTGNLNISGTAVIGTAAVVGAVTLPDLSDVAKDGFFVQYDNATETYQLTDVATQGALADPVPAANGGTGADLSTAAAGAILFSDGATPAVFGTSTEVTWNPDAQSGFNLRAISGDNNNQLPRIYDSTDTLRLWILGDGSILTNGLFDWDATNGILFMGATELTETHLTFAALGNGLVVNGFDLEVGGGWSVLGADYSWAPLGDNDRDLGSATAQVRTGYFGTSVVIGTASIADGVVSLNLPTSDPAVAGQLWVDGVTVKVSAGP